MRWQYTMFILFYADIRYEYETKYSLFWMMMMLVLLLFSLLLLVVLVFIFRYFAKTSSIKLYNWCARRCIRLTICQNPYRWKIKWIFCVCTFQLNRDENFCINMHFFSLLLQLYLCGHTSENILWVWYILHIYLLNLISHIENFGSKVYFYCVLWLLYCQHCIRCVTHINTKLNFIFFNRSNLWLFN